MATTPPGVDRRTWKAWVDKCPLRIYRHEHEMSVMQAATVLGVSMTLIQLWERGVHVPSNRNMDSLVRLLGEDTATEWATWFNSRPMV